MVTVTLLPLTVAPEAGVLNEALSADGPFWTVTGMLLAPVLLVVSRTDAVRVVGPSGVPPVSHGKLIGPFDVSLVVATVWPPAVSVNVLVPAAAPLIQMMTHCVPVTVAPLAGWVMKTEIVPLFCTVTVRVAVAVVPAASPTVRPSVWLPSG